MPSRPGGRAIVAFFEGSGTDARGRTLARILAFDDGELERYHDFIQWLFPLRERSGADPSAPVLDDETVAAFARRSELRAAQRRAFDRMLAFYGFLREGERIVPGESFEARALWLTPNNHNHLRLTRMLISSRLLGAEDQARLLFEALRSIVERDRRAGYERVTPRTFAFWRDAMSEPPAT